MIFRLATFFSRVNFKTFARVVFSIGLLSVATLGFAVQAPTANGYSVTIKSNILNEDRQLLIATPLYYSTNEQPASVLYVLDGEENFRHVIGFVHGLSGMKQAPPVLVVAIVNTDRDRDSLTPPATPEDQQSAPTAGGAENFVRFLQEELIPWVEGNYEVTDYNVVLGHSFGGHLALHTLLNHPEIFDAYVVSDPSAWWNNQALAKQAKDLLVNNQLQQEKLFISQSDTSGAIETQALVSVLGQYDEEQLQTKFQFVTERSYITMPRSAANLGLQYIFNDWLLEDPLRLFDEKGLQGIHDYFGAVDQKYGTDRGTPSYIILLLIRQLFAANRLDDLAEFILANPSLYPYPPEALNQIAGYFQDKGELAKASQCYTLALRASPSNNIARNMLSALGVDVDALIKEFAPDETLLKKFAGRYKLANGNIWDFKVVDQSLYAVVDGNLQPLVMQSPTRYALSVGSIFFEFTDTENAQPASLKVKYESIKWEQATRLDADTN